MLRSINNKSLFCFPVISIGFLDLVTTVAGILFFGATEVNPLLSGLTQTNMAIFIGIKSSTVLLTGFLFYKGASMAEKSLDKSNIGMRILKIGYLLVLLLLTLVVTNNILTIFQLV